MSNRTWVAIGIEVWGAYLLGLSFGLASGIGQGIDAQSRTDLYRRLVRDNPNPYDGLLGQLLEPLLFHIHNIRYEYAWYAYQRQDVLTETMHDPAAYAILALFVAGVGVMTYGVLYAFDVVPDQRDLVYIWRSIGPQKYFQDHE